VIDSDQRADRPALGDERHHAVCGAHGKQIHDPRLERDQRRVEGDEQQQKRKEEDAAEKSGMRPFMYSLWSSSAAVTPPTWASMPEPLRAVGTTSSRMWLTEVLRLLVLGRGRRIAVMSAASPVRLIRGPATNVIPGSWRRRSAKRGDPGLRDGPGSCAAITSGPFVPGPNPGC